MDINIELIKKEQDINIEFPINIPTENIIDSKDIISFTAFESVTPIIHDDSPNNDGTVVYDTNQNIFLYKIGDNDYYRNWYNKDMYIRDSELINDKIYFCTDLGILCAVKPSNTGSVLTPISQNSIGQNKSVIYPNSRIITTYSADDTKMNFGIVDDFYNQNYTSEIDIYIDKDASEPLTIGFPDTIKWNKEPPFNIGKHYSIIIECVIINNVPHYSGIWAEFDF